MDTDGESWEILQKENHMEQIDKYNFAAKNFYRTREDLEQDLFDLLMRLTLQDAETVSRMLVGRGNRFLV